MFIEYVSLPFVLFYNQADKKSLLLVEMVKKLHHSFIELRTSTGFDRPELQIGPHLLLWDTKTIKGFLEAYEAGKDQTEKFLDDYLNELWGSFTW